MTRTPPTGPDAPVFPPGRYGRRRATAGQRRHRWVVWLLAGLVAVGGVGIAIKLYDQYAEAPYRARVIRVTELTDTKVTFTFEVVKPAGQGAICTVLAHTRDGLEVGRAEVTLAPGPDERTEITYTLPTTQRAVTGEVPGCGPTR